MAIRLPCQSSNVAFSRFWKRSSTQINYIARVTCPMLSRKGYHLTNWYPSLTPKSKIHRFVLYDNSRYCNTQKSLPCHPVNPSHPPLALHARTACGCRSVISSQELLWITCTAFVEARYVKCACKVFWIHMINKFSLVSLSICSFDMFAWINFC